MTLRLPLVATVPFVAFKSVVFSRQSFERKKDSATGRPKERHQAKYTDTIAQTTTANACGNYRSNTGICYAVMFQHGRTIWPRTQGLVAENDTIRAARIEPLITLRHE